MVAKDALFIETARTAMRDSYRIIDVVDFARVAHDQTARRAMVPEKQTTIFVD